MDDAPRAGTVRPSMMTNPLIVHSELGKTKPANLPKLPQDHSFGYSIRKDPEGAREVMGIWKSHEAPVKVQPRISPHVTVKTKTKSSPKKAPLPSDKDLSFTFGMPSSHRSAEVVRSKGDKEASIKMLIQGAFADEWLSKHSADAEKANAAAAQAYIPPVPTRATIGHAIGAQRYLKKDEAGEEWKMSKFRDVPSKITQYMH